MREPSVTFWAQELVTREQVDALTAQKVDILVTHEAPQGMRLGHKDSSPESVAQRDLVQEIQDKVQPALHVCGHHHVQASWTNGGTEVRVLGRDGMNDLSVMLVDLAGRFGATPSLEVV
jgi:Icc-related predicted phosphoesterase